MKPLEILGLLTMLAGGGWAFYKLDQIDKGQDDILDRLDEIECDNAMTTATTHRALLGTPDDRDDLKREYQQVFTRDEDEGHL